MKNTIQIGYDSEVALAKLIIRLLRLKNNQHVVIQAADGRIEVHFRGSASVVQDLVYKFLTDQKKSILVTDKMPKAKPWPKKGL